MRSAWLGSWKTAVLGAACALAGMGCGCRRAETIPEATPLPAATPAPEAASGGEQPAQPQQPTPLAPETLHGSWVEYWALSGRAETQRFTFMPDGRFGWCAGPDSLAPPARRWGRFSVAGDELVLSVQGEDATADCDGKAACRAAHQPALEEHLALGACPANDEARALDANYRCISVGGQAFWLREGQGKSDAEAAKLAK